MEKDVGNSSPQRRRERRVYNFLLSADPRGIGSAFHRAEEGRKQKTQSAGGRLTL